MKKPAPDASLTKQAAYREWVRAQLENWDPADDRGGPTVYVPRYNGIKALEVENVEREPDDQYNDD
jgi:hypothetical protein